jgi:hypothetical protein
MVHVETVKAFGDLCENLGRPVEHLYLPVYTGQKFLCLLLCIVARTV